MSALLKQSYPELNCETVWGKWPLPDITRPNNAEIAHKVRAGSYTVAKGPDTPLRRGGRSTRNSAYLNRVASLPLDMDPYIMFKSAPDMPTDKLSPLLYTYMDSKITGPIAALRSGHIIGDSIHKGNRSSQDDWCELCGSLFLSNLQQYYPPALRWLRIAHTLMLCPLWAGNWNRFLVRWKDIGVKDDRYWGKVVLLWHQVQEVHVIDGASCASLREFLAMILHPDRYKDPSLELRKPLITAVAELVTPSHLCSYFDDEPMCSGAVSGTSVAGLSPKFRAGGTSTPNSPSSHCGCEADAHRAKGAPAGVL